MRKGLTILAGLAGLLAGGSVMALEYRSVATPAILYDAPSEQGKRLYVISRLTPVEVVVSLDKWVKVRDMGGGLAWIERGRLTDRRTLQVSAARAAVRQQPDDSATVLFEAAKDLVLDLAEPPAGGWVKVRHKDGTSGYIRVTDVWGL